MKENYWASLGVGDTSTSDKNRFYVVKHGKTLWSMKAFLKILTGGAVRTTERSLF